MNPLEEATLEELIDEVKRRHKAVLIIGIMDPKVDDGCEDCLMHYSGGFTTALGLAVRARDTLRSRASEDDEDDD